MENKKEFLVKCKTFGGTAIEIMEKHCNVPFEQRQNVIQAMEEYASQNKLIGYQKCPKCDAQGTVSKPPHIPGDVHSWASTSSVFICDVCNGAKILPMYPIPAPPEK